MSPSAFQLDIAFVLKNQPHVEEKSTDTVDLMSLFSPFSHLNTKIQGRALRNSSGIIYAEYFLIILGSYLRNSCLQPVILKNS